ncbi:MAG: hypothetical protein GY906_00975 [bacterium]|nr:hypothetical protein [bacterium]
MMLRILLSEVAHAALITSLVFVMMAVVELLAIGSRGRLTAFMGDSRWRQYSLAALLGAIPGCAGAYLAVSMYSHASLSLGAVTAALIATTGDDAFVMLAIMPMQAALLFAGLMAVAILGGCATDSILRRFGVERTDPCALAELHEEDLTEDSPLSRWQPIRLRWAPALPRTILLLAMALLVIGLITGVFAHGAAEHVHTGHTLEQAHQGLDLEAWIFLIVGLVGIVLVAVAPEHDLGEHLWRHLALHHAPRIFAWTASTLVIVAVLNYRFHLEALVEGRGVWLLVGGALLGLIPQSGPHLVVITLFFSGQVPLSVLIANSVVQDGHALLPMLGISPRDAFLAKGANLAIGLAIGALIMIAGW